MQSFKELAEKRESCRAYRSDPVPRELIDAIIETTLLAPSARNTQPVIYHVVSGEPANRIFREAMAEYGWNTWGLDCPSIIVLESEIRQKERLGNTYDFAVIDTGIRLAYLSLAAAEKGLGTCIIGAEDERKIKSILGIGDDKRVYCSLAIGWPVSDTPRPKERFPLSDSVRYHF